MKCTKMLPPSILALACLLNCCDAFDSYGVGGGKTGGTIHGDITSEAAKRLKINDCDDLEEAVRNPDWEQTSFLKPNKDYNARSHFDRGPAKDSKQAFDEAAEFVRTERGKIVAFVKMDNPKAALASLGRVLHAVQDLVSHSNVVDLSEEQRNTVWESIWNRNETVPGGLKLTGYDPKADEPGNPDGDNYGHDKFCKDNAKKNAEATMKIGTHTKFQIAYSLAVEFSEQILDGVKSELGDDGWQRLAKTFD